MGPQGSFRTCFRSRNQPDARPCVSGAPVAAEGWGGLKKKEVENRLSFPKDYASL